MFIKVVDDRKYLPYILIEEGTTRPSRHLSREPWYLLSSHLCASRQTTPNAHTYAYVHISGACKQTLVHPALRSPPRILKTSKAAISRFLSHATDSQNRSLRLHIIRPRVLLSTDRSLLGVFGAARQSDKNTLPLLMFMSTQI